MWTKKFQMYKLGLTKSRDTRDQTVKIHWIIEEARKFQGKKKKNYFCFPMIKPLTVVNSVQSFSHVQLFETPLTAASQASLSINNSQSLLKLMSFELEMPSHHLILSHPLLLLSIFPSIRVFSNESALRISWPKYWSLSFSISPSNEYSELISFRMDWLELHEFQGISRVFSNTTVQKHQFFFFIN